MWDKGGSRDDLLDAKEFTDCATVNSTACNLPATILNIDRWTGREAEEELDQGSSMPEIFRADKNSGSGDL